MITDLALSLQSTLARRVGVWTFDERVTATVRPLLGLLLVVFIHQVARRNPWPRPFRVSFAAMHAGIAVLTALAWIVLSRTVEAIFLGWGSTVPYEQEFFVFGLLAYVIVGGISYSVESTARAARAESAAAQTQLAALRAQLHPHFLFNALHTVVQLIPANPQQAMEAAEIVADLLRSSLEEQREEVSVAEEWRFVSRYLAMERIRFGDRLVVRDSLGASALDARLPTFALQTLIENAVRHGASPRVQPTTVSVVAERSGDRLVLTVENDADVRPGTPAGTGLARLRERLTVLYGNAASLQGERVPGGYRAVLVVPQSKRRAGS